MGHHRCFRNQFSPFHPVLHCPLGLAELQASLMLSFHLFFCLPYLLSISLCLAKWFWPDLMNGKHCSLRLFTMVRSSCGPTACWILARTSSLVTWSLYEMGSILRKHLISMACILLLSSTVRVHDSQAYRKMDVTRERISRILEPVSYTHLTLPTRRTV